jgi:predicted metal-dependent enzyme (double-stranded beta helix superfamily)
MTINTNGITYSVNDFVADAKRIIISKGTSNTGLQVIATYLHKLVMEGGDLTMQGKEMQHHNNLPGRRLYEDPDGQFRISIVYFAPDKPTPVHSHYRWGAECVISGQERVTVWELTNQDTESQTAKLKVLSDRYIKRGETQVWLDPPKNIHRQWAHGDESVCLIIILGGDGSRQHEFNLEDSTYQNVS